MITTIERFKKAVRDLLDSESVESPDNKHEEIEELRTQLIRDLGLSLDEVRELISVA